MPPCKRKIRDKLHRLLYEIPVMQVETDEDINSNDFKEAASNHNIFVIKKFFQHPSTSSVVTKHFNSQNLEISHGGDMINILNQELDAEGWDINNSRWEAKTLQEYFKYSKYLEQKLEIMSSVYTTLSRNSLDVTHEVDSIVQDYFSSSSKASPALSPEILEASISLNRSSTSPLFLLQLLRAMPKLDSRTLPAWLDGSFIYVHGMKLSQYKHLDTRRNRTIRKNLFRKVPSTTSTVTPITFPIDIESVNGQDSKESGLQHRPVTRGLTSPSSAQSSPAGSPSAGHQWQQTRALYNDAKIVLSRIDDLSFKIKGPGCQPFTITTLPWIRLDALVIVSKESNLIYVAVKFVNTVTEANTTITSSSDTNLRKTGTLLYGPITRDVCDQLLSPCDDNCQGEVRHSSTSSNGLISTEQSAKMSQKTTSSLGAASSYGAGDSSNCSADSALRLSVNGTGVPRPFNATSVTSASAVDYGLADSGSIPPCSSYGITGPTLHAAVDDITSNTAGDGSAIGICRQLTQMQQYQNSLLMQHWPLSHVPLPQYYLANKEAVQPLTYRLSGSPHLSGLTAVSPTASLKDTGQLYVQYQQHPTYQLPNYFGHNNDLNRTLFELSAPPVSFPNMHPTIAQPALTSMPIHTAGQAASIANPHPHLHPLKSGETHTVIEPKHTVHMIPKPFDVHTSRKYVLNPSAFIPHGSQLNALLSTYPLPSPLISMATETAPHYPATAKLLTVPLPVMSSMSAAIRLPVPDSVFPSALPLLSRTVIESPYPPPSMPAVAAHTLFSAASTASMSTLDSYAVMSKGNGQVSTRDPRTCDTDSKNDSSYLTDDINKTDDALLSVIANAFSHWWSDPHVLLTELTHLLLNIDDLSQTSVLSVASRLASELRSKTYADSYDFVDKLKALLEAESAQTALGNGGDGDSGPPRKKGKKVCKTSTSSSASTPSIYSPSAMTTDATATASDKRENPTGLDADDSGANENTVAVSVVTETDVDAMAESGEPKGEERPGTSNGTRASGAADLKAVITASKHEDLRRSKKESAKRIEFCSNMDLTSDSWLPQLAALQRCLPKWMRCCSSMDMLGLARQDIPGVNVPQVYVKVPGVWTGAHEENCRLQSINCNMGPGASEWCAIAACHVPRLRRQIFESHKIDILRQEGRWFPDTSCLVDLEIPYMYGIQEAGDVVVLQGATMHWVRSLGFAVHVSWNLCSLSYDQLQSSLVRYVDNNRRDKGKTYKNVLPLQSLFWDMILYFTENITADGSDLDRAAWTEPKLLTLLAQTIITAFSDDNCWLAEVIASTGLTPVLEYPGSMVMHCCRHSCEQEILRSYLYCPECGILCLNCASTCCVRDTSGALKSAVKHAPGTLLYVKELPEYTNTKLELFLQTLSQLSLEGVSEAARSRMQDTKHTVPIGLYLLRGARKCGVPKLKFCPFLADARKTGRNFTSKQISSEVQRAEALAASSPSATMPDSCNVADLPISAEAALFMAVSQDIREESVADSTSIADKKEHNAREILFRERIWNRPEQRVSSQSLSAAADCGATYEADADRANGIADALVSTETVLEQQVVDEAEEETRRDFEMNWKDVLEFSDIHGHANIKVASRLGQFASSIRRKYYHNKLRGYQLKAVQRADGEGRLMWVDRVSKHNLAAKKSNKKAHPLPGKMVDCTSVLRTQEGTVVGVDVEPEGQTLVDDTATGGERRHDDNGQLVQRKRIKDDTSEASTKQINATDLKRNSPNIIFIEDDEDEKAVSDTPVYAVKVFTEKWTSLMEFAEREGHGNVPRNHPECGRFVSHIRPRYFHGELLPFQQVLVDAAYQAGKLKWTNLVTDTKSIVPSAGGEETKATSSPNPQLMQTTVDPGTVEESVDSSCESRVKGDEGDDHSDEESDKLFTEQWTEVLNWGARNGHCNIPESDSPLGSFVRTVRRRYMSRELPKYQLQLVETADRAGELKWKDDEYSASVVKKKNCVSNQANVTLFYERWSEVMKFAVANGHANMDWSDRPLGKYLNQIKNKYFRNQLQDYQLPLVKAADEAGMLHWVNKLKTSSSKDSSKDGDSEEDEEGDVTAEMDGEMNELGEGNKKNKREEGKLKTVQKVVKSFEEKWAEVMRFAEDRGHANIHWKAEYGSFVSKLRSRYYRGTLTGDKLRVVKEADEAGKLSWTNKCKASVGKGGRTSDRLMEDEEGQSDADDEDTDSDTMVDTINRPLTRAAKSRVTHSTEPDNVSELGSDTQEEEGPRQPQGEEQKFWRQWLQLLEYSGINGHANVPSKQHKLGDFVNTIRSLYHRKLLVGYQLKAVSEADRAGLLKWIYSDSETLVTAKHQRDLVVQQGESTVGTTLDEVDVVLVGNAGNNCAQNPEFSEYGMEVIQVSWVNQSSTVQATRGRQQASASAPTSGVINPISVSDGEEETSTKQSNIGPYTQRMRASDVVEASLAGMGRATLADSFTLSEQTKTFTTAASPTKRLVQSPVTRYLRPPGSRRIIRIAPSDLSHRSLSGVTASATDPAIVVHPSSPNSLERVPSLLTTVCGGDKEEEEVLLRQFSQSAQTLNSDYGACSSVEGLGDVDQGAVFATSDLGGDNKYVTGAVSLPTADTASATSACRACINTGDDAVEILEQEVVAESDIWTLLGPDSEHLTAAVMDETPVTELADLLGRGTLSEAVVRATVQSAMESLLATMEATEGGQILHKRKSSLSTSAGDDTGRVKRRMRHLKQSDSWQDGTTVAVDAVDVSVRPLYESPVPPTNPSFACGVTGGESLVASCCRSIYAYDEDDISERHRMYLLFSSLVLMLDTTGHLSMPSDRLLYAKLSCVAPARRGLTVAFPIGLWAAEYLVKLRKNSFSDVQDSMFHYYLCSRTGCRSSAEDRILESLVTASGRKCGGGTVATDKTWLNRVESASSTSTLNATCKAWKHVTSGLFYYPGIVVEPSDIPIVAEMQAVLIEAHLKSVRHVSRQIAGELYEYRNPLYETDT